MTGSRIPTVEVPDEEQGIIASLIRLTDPALDALERALCEATPTLDRQDLVSQLRREPLLAEISDLNEIVGSLVSFVGTAYSGHFGAVEFAKLVVDAIQKDDVIEMPDAEAEILRARLARLASSKCLELIAKGNILLRANDRNYRSAQITTDMRPVYLGEEVKVSAGLILHQLAIKTSHNGKSDTVFVTLDSADLVSFSRVISRAMKKEKALSDFAGESGTPVLTPPSEE